MSVITDEDKSPFEIAIDEGGRIAESIIANNKVSAEHQRLKDAVVAQAKVFTSNEEARDNWDALVAYRELCRAVDALIAFEADNGIGDK